MEDCSGRAEGKTLGSQTVAYNTESTLTAALPEPV